MAKERAQQQMDRRSSPTAKRYREIVAAIAWFVSFVGCSMHATKETVTTMNMTRNAEMKPVSINGVTISRGISFSETLAKLGEPDDIDRDVADWSFVISYYRGGTYYYLYFS